MMNNVLYIGLNGFAGSGKDTVAKALRLMLSYDFKSYNEFRSMWEHEVLKMRYATFGMSPEDDTCYCIAFADQLKHICSEMFGIPVEAFYYNKETSWIDIAGTFEYTETRPYSDDIITADEYYYAVNSNTIMQKPTWMSLRELLVYVGTYVCQPFINNRCFVNGVQNKVKQVIGRNKNLKYVICTDVRFYHEMEFIRHMNGININIQRDSVEQLDNIAEHDLDDEEGFDFIIHNNGTYDELLLSLWDLVHNNAVFSNTTVTLPSHDGSNNYLRKYSENSWYCCFEHDTIRVTRDNGQIVAIDPSGGPMISVGMSIPDMGIVSSIRYDEDGNFGFAIDI